MLQYEWIILSTCNFILRSPLISTMLITFISVGLAEKAMAPHSSTLAWKLPWKEEPGGLQSMGSLKVGHNWVTSLSVFTLMHWRRKCQPFQCSCLENPRGGGARWAAVFGVAQSRTWLKWLSSSSSCWVGSTVFGFSGFLSWFVLSFW